MFDFEVSAEMQALLGRYREFVEREVLPLEAKAAGRPFSELELELEQLRQRARRDQLFGPQIPVALGGLGLSFREHALVSEVLGRSPLGHFAMNCQAPDAGNSGSPPWPTARASPW